MLIERDAGEVLYWSRSSRGSPRRHSGGRGQCVGGVQESCVTIMIWSDSSVTTVDSNTMQGNQRILKLIEIYRSVFYTENRRTRRVTYSLLARFMKDQICSLPR